MLLIDNLLITEFKGHVREEAPCLNQAGLRQGLRVKLDPVTVQVEAKSCTMPSWHLSTEKTKCSHILSMQAMQITKPLQKRMPQAHHGRI